MKTHKDLDCLAEIRPEERDYYLGLRSQVWGEDLERWKEVRKPHLHYSRIVPVHEETQKETAGPTRLEELIIPFPSAPIYGINRNAEYSKVLEHRPNMHSVRLLRRPSTAPIHRLFILHNGLNEAESLKFYYRLADWVMRQQEEISPDEGVACLIMPFPGHLMHSSFHGPFSETPLSRYLNDAGDLYRQFLRYMIGIQWLLSIVADSDAESWMVGGDLLDPKTRVTDLVRRSHALYDMSAKRIARTKLSAIEEGTDTNEGSTFDIGEKTSMDQALATDALLRTALERDSDQTPPSLRVHVVGYSLGGFVAQSVFFAWPQVVSSCTTICSGGAISALSPTAFAQPEEWQSVLHALRPETTNSMLQGRLGDDERVERSVPTPVETVVGMPLSQYGYFHRIFEQVFLQEDRGSYKERLSEYGLRMFFVSGGEDPIVPPGNILDASPREGTTMLSVAGMTHFLNQDPKDDGDRRETEQRDFWLPEAGGMIARAAIHAEKVHLDERAEAANLKRRRVRPASQAQALDPKSSNLLSNGYMFEAGLDWVLNAVSDDDGWLVICRNVLPAAFIPTQDFTKWGSGLHHHDLRIQRYTLGLRHRARMLRRIKGRTTLIVPEQLRHLFVNLSARFEPHSDGPEGRLTTKRERERIWREFEKDWWPTLRRFEAGNMGISKASEPYDIESFTTKVSSWLKAEEKFLEATHLPDVWIGISADSKLIPAQSRSRKQVHGAVVEGVESVLFDLARLRDTSPEKGSVVTKAKKRLEDDLSEGRIRMIQISGAEFNPRFRGKIEMSATGAARLLASVAAGLVRSDQIGEPPTRGA